MKYVFTTLIVFGLAFHTLKAQELVRPNVDRFKFGVFAGVNHTYSFVINRYPNYFKPQNNLVAGVDLQYHLMSRASVHLQPSWTQFTDAESQQPWTISTFSLTTLKLPVIYRYYLSPNRRSFFVQAGVSYNYLASSKYREQIDVVCITSPCPNFLGPNISPSNKSAVSGLAGIGINLELQKISIPISLQYERYLSNYLFPNQFDDQSTRVKFEYVSLTTGVTF